MIKEIYCKLPTDKDYFVKIETINELEQILQQIKIILGTKPGEVLGSYDFGLDLSQYLFTMNVDQATILYTVNTHLNRYLRFDRNKWTIYADISYGHDKLDSSDYAVIDIVINERKCLGILVNQQ